jgi:hypothetical protein
MQQVLHGNAAARIVLACRNFPFLAVVDVPGLWLLNDMKKELERVVGVW